MNAAPIGWSEYARLMLVLCGILALAVVAIRFWLPRLSRWNKPANGPIEICARLPLEARKTLYIVKAANSYMLLASSEAGVQHLAALSPDECSAWREKSELSSAKF
ncbi:MAG: FliO/MopB family protein [Acidobacteriaceae bacterium]|nr:FliO/MopB family protein [Acidobacteriaceae bacterium]MBV8570811.1 FliO/MopB family protein [Acidobacteriaceae bacterium]